jgi:hypothetical protein
VHKQLPTGGDVVPDFSRELEASSQYTDVRIYGYPWDQRYTSSEYSDLLRTYSGSQSMAEGERESMIRELSAVIDQEYGGGIVRPLVITLTAARVNSSCLRSTSIDPETTA